MMSAPSPRLAGRARENPSQKSQPKKPSLERYAPKRFILKDMLLRVN
jgi:hypothetical protein